MTKYLLALALVASCTDAPAESQQDDDTVVMDGFFPAAGEEDPSVQTAATQLRARTKQLMLNMVNGKPVDLSTLPGFAQLTSELQQQGGVTTPAPASPGQPPLDFNQLLQGPPSQTPQQPEEEQ